MLSFKLHRPFPCKYINSLRCLRCCLEPGSAFSKKHRRFRGHQIPGVCSITRVGFHSTTAIHSDDLGANQYLDLSLVCSWCYLTSGLDSGQSPHSVKGFTRYDLNQLWAFSHILLLLCSSGGLTSSQQEEVWGELPCSQTVAMATAADVQN